LLHIEGVGSIIFLKGIEDGLYERMIWITFVILRWDFAPYIPGVGFDILYENELSFPALL